MSDGVHAQRLPSAPERKPSGIAIAFSCLESTESGDADPEPLAGLAPAQTVFTQTELELPRRLSQKQVIPEDATISDYLLALATPGGHPARKSDHPPGNKVIWRGRIRLMDIHLKNCVAKGDVGN